MAIDVKKQRVERLVDEVVAISGESKSEVVRRAVEERKGRLEHRRTPEAREAMLMRLLEREIRPQVPSDIRGRDIGRAEEDAILGYDSRGA